MKKRNILTLILVLIIILFKIDVNAATCTTTEKSNLKKLARMIEINAVLNAEENVWDEYFYEVTFSNWNENFYIVDKSGNTFYKEPTETENSLGLIQVNYNINGKPHANDDWVYVHQERENTNLGYIERLFVLNSSKEQIQICYPHRADAGWGLVSCMFVETAFDV